MTDRHPQLRQFLHGPVEQRLVDGRPAYFAPGVPVLEPDACRYEVTRIPQPGETGAVGFARDIGCWLSRLFGQPVRRTVHRENRWDHRPCPRAQTAEFTLDDGHVIVVTAYDVAPSRQSPVVMTTYAVHVDGVPVEFTPRRDTVRLAWQLAWAAWKAATDLPRR